MANADQLKRLRHEPRHWNEWRRNSGEPVDLSGADLRAANLKGLDLSEANLDGASLTGADLTKIREEVRPSPVMPAPSPGGQKAAPATLTVWDLIDGLDKREDLP